MADRSGGPDGHPRSACLVRPLLTPRGPENGSTLIVRPTASKRHSAGGHRCPHLASTPLSRSVSLSLSLGSLSLARARALSLSLSLSRSPALPLSRSPVLSLPPPPPLPKPRRGYSLARATQGRRSAACLPRARTPSRRRPPRHSFNALGSFVVLYLACCLPAMPGKKPKGRTSYTCAEYARCFCIRTKVQGAEQKLKALLANSKGVSLRLLVSGPGPMFERRLPHPFSIGGRARGGATRGGNSMMHVLASAVHVHGGPAAPAASSRWVPPASPPLSLSLSLHLSLARSLPGR